MYNKMNHVTNLLSHLTIPYPVSFLVPKYSTRQILLTIEEFIAAISPLQCEFLKWLSICSLQTVDKLFNYFNTDTTQRYSYLSSNLWPTIIMQVIQHIQALLTCNDSHYWQVIDNHVASQLAVVAISSHHAVGTYSHIHTEVITAN